MVGQLKRNLSDLNNSVLCITVFACIFKTSLKNLVEGEYRLKLGMTLMGAALRGSVSLRGFLLA